MANSLYVPMDRLPATLAEVRSIVCAAVAEFNLPSPAVKLHRDDVADRLLNAFVLVEGVSPGHSCWLSFGDHAGQPSVSEGRRYLVDIQTRSSWTFAGMVALGFCRYADSIVLNDAGVLGVEETYSAEALHAVLNERQRKAVVQEAGRAAFDLALDQDLDQTGIVGEENFDLLDLAYWYDSAATVGWVEARLRVLAARLDRGEGLSLLDPASGRQIIATMRAEFEQWAAEHFPVVAERMRAEDWSGQRANVPARS